MVRVKNTSIVRVKNLLQGFGLGDYNEDSCYELTSRVRVRTFQQGLGL